MSNGKRCGCNRCRARGLMGPVVLIALGVLVLVGQHGGRYSFGKLWPILLIVIGVVMIWQAVASSEGHVGRFGR